MTDVFTPIKRVLISVSDKTGIVEFARALSAHGAQILSTGGTARLLLEQSVAITEVSDYTGFPEMMAGRVKTLHPKIHAGILARRGLDEQIMADNGIQPIDMVVVNLYPFAATVARQGCSLDDAIENIDVGGPTLLRAAAKNYRDVAVVSQPSDYAALQASLQQQGGLSQTQRYALAAKAFARTAHYDTLVSRYLLELDNQHSNYYPDTLCLSFEKIQDMRYGENPHQTAAFYRDTVPTKASLASAVQLQGKAMSYNNVVDTNAALSCVKQFERPACVIVKHANPCGVGVAESLQAAYQKAFQTDPTSAFGGIIACNQILDAETAKAIVEQQFVEVIIAPEVADNACLVLASKDNVRVLECGQWQQPRPTKYYQRIEGGLLVQDCDQAMISADDLRIVSQRKPSDAELSDLLFAWKVAKFVKSNAIVYAKSQQTIGIGAGQMSRVYSARIAAIKASDENLAIQGAVMASDAFFPFRDGIDSAATAGIRAVIQPGGSLRDDEVIEAANENAMAMVFTGMRHFKH